MTTAPYNPNIPTPETNTPENQQNFLNNFSKLFDAFSQNHVALNAAASAGNHNAIELIELDDDKSPSTDSQEIAIFTKKAAGSTDQIWMRYPSNGKEFQLTEYQIYALEPVRFNNVAYQFPYFSFLPGGIIVYFGRVLPTLFGGASPVYIALEPAICKNIMAVNLCPIGAVNANLPHSNVTLVSSQGKFSSIALNTLAGSALPDQYYLAFGNI